MASGVWRSKGVSGAFVVRCGRELGASWWMREAGQGQGNRAKKKL
jgi:hypothetical protein